MPDKEKLADLLKRVDTESVPWKPEPGEKLAGVVVDRTTRTGDYGTYPILEIDTGDEVNAFHAFHTVARREIEDRRVRVGDVIAIKFLGEVTDGDRTYFGYKVSLDRDVVPAPEPEVPADEPSEWAESG